MRWDADREFVGQGVAKLVAGLFGGFPAGGSFSRSAVAVQAGARTPRTGAFTGLLVLAALPAVGLLETLPLAVLGAVIFTSVLSLLDLGPVWELRRWSRQQFVIAVVTFVSTVAVAPQIHWAILTGVALSVAADLLGQHPDVDRLVLHMQQLGRADVTGALALRDIVDHLASTDVPVEIHDATPTSQKILDRVIGSRS